jgi:hypothetical protein
VQFNNHLLAKENKTLLEYNETLLALGGIISIHMASFLDSSFMNQNNKPNLLLIMGMLGAVLFVCWILFESSRIGIQLQCFIVQPICLRYFIATIKTTRNGFNLCLFNLSL